MLCIPACGAGRPAFSCTIGSLQTHTKRTINNDTETYLSSPQGINASQQDIQTG